MVRMALSASRSATLVARKTSCRRVFMTLPTRRSLAPLPYAYAVST